MELNGVKNPRIAIQALNPHAEFGTEEKDEIIPAIEEAKKLDQLGCIAIVLEAVPQHVGAAVSKAVSIPVVGVGAGLDVDGQALVLPDMLGFSTDFKPKFVRTYMNGADLIKDAVNQFAADVHAKTFPGVAETYAPGKDQVK